MHGLSGSTSLHAHGLLAGLLALGSFAIAGCNSDEVSQPHVPSSPQMPVNMAAVPTTGLVGEWKLNESGGITAADTKNGYNADVFGGAAFVAGKLGNALNLNNGAAGTGGKYAEMPSNFTLDNVQKGDYSISAWFYAYSVPTNATTSNRNWAIVAKHGQHMGLFYENSRQFSVRHYLENTQFSANSANLYSPNTWHHIVGVVSKSTGAIRVYVNGTLQGTTSFDPALPVHEYGTNPFRIGRARIDWAADGKVDQVRIYNRALTATDVANLFDETQSASFRFPVGMFKGQQLDLLGMQYTPDGHLTAGAGRLLETLEAARTAGARVTVRVTGGNANFYNGSDFDTTLWKQAFDPVSGIDVSDYVADGTLIGHYAIDEPYSDFANLKDSPRLGTTLERMCQYQKSFAGWRSVPCLVREINTRLRKFMPAGGYKYLDAGWSQLTDHQYVPATLYDGDIGAYYRANIDSGRVAGLGMMYGFNLVNGGREVTGCDKPNDPNDRNCAMSAAEVRAMADTIAAIGQNKGCGVLGYEIEATAGANRDYFFSRGVYSDNGIQSSMQYLNSKLGAWRSGSCNIRGDLPAP